MLFAYSGNPNEGNRCYFEWISITKPFFINSFNQLKETTKTLLGVPPRSLFLSNLTPVSESAKVKYQKTTRCSLLNVEQLNYHNDTDQGRFLVVRRDFTVIYKNPKRGDRKITQIIKPIRSSKRSLQLKRGLLNVFLNFAKQSPFQSPYRLCWTVLFDSEFCIYEWKAIQKILYYK